MYDPSWLHSIFGELNVAQQFGSTTQTSIARWEAGRVRPSAETLSEIARACGLELRVGLAEPDPSEASLLESTSILTPAERLDQLVRTVAFIRAGREALAERHG